MKYNFLTEADYDNINQWIKFNHLICTQCNKVKFGITPGITVLSFIDVSQEPPVKQKVGKLLVSLNCKNCATMLFLDAEAVLPHYFKR